MSIDGGDDVVSLSNVVVDDGAVAGAARQHVHVPRQRAHAAGMPVHNLLGYSFILGLSGRENTHMRIYK